MLRRSLFPLGFSPLWAAFAQSTLSSVARDEAFWTMLRKQFPLRDGLVYLNAANVCPASLPVLDRHQHFLRDFEADPSFQNRAKFGPLRERVRVRAAQFFGVTADEIAFTRNTSEATNTIVHGLNLKAGDEVMLIEDNHPSNLDSWKNQAKRLGFSLNILPMTQLIDSAEQLAAKVEAGFTPKTKVVSLTHVTSSTGVLYPVAEICRRAREKGIWCHVDGAQSGGMLPVDLRRIGCDSYATSSHKWLMGPLEAGVLYVASYRQKEVWPSIVSVGYSEDGKGGARFLEAYGQRDDARLVALDATFEFLTMIGMASVEARIRQLTTHLMNELAKNPKVQLRTNRKEELYCGVVKADLPSVADLRAFDAKLYSDHGMAFSVTPSGPIRGIRISPHVYNSIEQMNAVAEAFRKA
ncbi:MAG: aminotransferase class V-fold PLP-dependent enzyme [Acidobacteria bacterium]|nr:aminotransferase class V-fold PLP-dependent enzyme [Acidobacteriota bacterium]